MLDDDENDVVVPDDHLPGDTLIPVEKISRSELLDLPAIDFE